MFEHFDFFFLSNPLKSCKFIPCEHFTPERCTLRFVVICFSFSEAINTNIKDNHNIFPLAKC